MNLHRLLRVPIPILDRRSIRFRLTVWYVAVLAAVLLAFSLGVYFFLIASIAADVNHITQSYRRVLTSEAASSPSHLGKVQRNTNLLGQLSIKYQGKVNLQQLSFGPPSGHYANQQLINTLFTGKQGCHSTKSDQLVCTYAVYSRSRHHQIVGAVSLQGSLDSVTHAQSRLRTALFLGIPISLLIALLGGWVLASRALAPVEDLRLTAQSITGSDLSRRIGTTRDDELGRLAQTFDDMIGRLETAFKEQRRLTADVSHELRTPLSVIHAQASLALRRERSPQEYAKTLSSIQEEAERMSRMVGDLLLLARAEAGQESIDREPVRLDAVAGWAADKVRELAAEKGVHLVVNVRPIMIDGDADRLRQLAMNLIDNALKYTPAGGTISVSVGMKDKQKGQLTVADTGEGIEEKHLPHIFQRFYRVDRARAGPEGSTGLGLAIVHWIATAHGATIDVSSRKGEGSTFTVTFPLPWNPPSQRTPRPRRRGKTAEPPLEVPVGSA